MIRESLGKTARRGCEVLPTLGWDLAIVSDVDEQQYLPSPRTVTRSLAEPETGTGQGLYSSREQGAPPLEDSVHPSWALAAP